MAKVIVGMTISLDGFVADKNGSAGRLYPDLAALRHTAYMIVMGLLWTATLSFAEPSIVAVGRSLGYDLQFNWPGTTWANHAKRILRALLTTGERN